MNSSVKCPSCGLINFGTAEKCKRCDADLGRVKEVSHEEAAIQAQQSRNPNLMTCSDCLHSVSRTAETCPQCGRVFSRPPLVIDRKGWAGTIGWGVVLSSFFFFLLGVLFWILVVSLFMGGSAMSR